MGRKHQGYHHQGKPEIPSEKIKTREGIGCEGTEYRITQQAGYADDKRIFKERTKGNNANSTPALDIVLQGPSFGNKAWITEYGCPFFKRSHNKPNHRIQHNKPKKNDDKR
ncbi:MAG: hypothetical protein LBL28_05945 [Treponema sp.]|nr:hypothetical protein [Treponema sp.]